MQMKKNLRIGLEVVTTGCHSTASPLAWPWHRGLSPLSGVAAGPAVASWASPSMARTEAGGGRWSFAHWTTAHPFSSSLMADRNPVDWILHRRTEQRKMDISSAKYPNFSTEHLAL
jgi:hypothetical protein